MFLDIFYVFMTAMFAALIVVPFLRTWALAQGELDLPDARKVHDVPMPRLGGVAIFLSFVFSVIIFVPFTPEIQGILAGSLIIFATGLVDDLTGLPAKHKFSGEVAACMAAIVIGNLWLSNLGNLFGFGDIILPAWIGIPFTVFAAVGVINAINLIDGLDGLAGGISVLALTAFFTLGWFNDNVQLMFIAAALAGSLLGFLKYNFYPARIFMGDAGSLTIGFVLAFMSVYTTQNSGHRTNPMVPVLILALPLIDTIWVMTRRAISGQSPFAADRAHVHHKFLDLGFEHRFTVVIIYGMSMFWASSALLMRQAPEYLLLLFLIITIVVFYMALRYVLNNPEQFEFLQRDSSTGLRTSSIYLRLAGLIDRTVGSLLFLLGGYFLLALWSAFLHCTVPWQMAFILIGIGLYLWYRPFADNRQFVILIIYVTVSLATLEVWHADNLLLSTVSIKRLGDVLLGIASLIVVLKLIFRREGELYLTTADYLTLAICIFLSIASQQNALGFNLNGPLLRAMIGIFIVRTLCSRKLPYFQLTGWLSMGFLALVGLIGVFARGLG